jgi:mannose-P-dolichol utilization defect protein 1
MEIVKDSWSQILNVAETQLGETCTKQLLVDFAILDNSSGCVSLAISKGLGLGLVAGGAILKLPQILKIVQSGSTQGISMPSYLLETISYTLSVIYNYRHNNPFTTYGEQPFITAQNLMILALIFFGRGAFLPWFMFIGAYMYGTRTLLNPDIVPNSILPTLYTAVTLLGVTSRVPQIYSNFKNKSTGQLAAATVLLTAAGAVARSFTTWKEVKDPNLMTGALIAVVLNLILAGQMLMYWSKPAGSVKKTQ